MKLDLGCGSKKAEGFIGVDQYPMDGVDVLLDIGTATWPWKDDSVEEVRCVHFLEHLSGTQRVHFFNELHRVLKKGAKATIVTPHWCSNRAYGDFTHQWPPVAEMLWYYLNSDWRNKEAPHTDAKWNFLGYSCNFDATWAYGMHPAILARNQEYQQHALQFEKEAAQDMHATLTALKP